MNAIENIGSTDIISSDSDDSSLKIIVTPSTTSEIFVSSSPNSDSFRYITLLSKLAIFLGITILISFDIINTGFDKSICEKTFLCYSNLQWIFPLLLILIGISGHSFTRKELNDRENKNLLMIILLCLVHILMILGMILYSNKLNLQESSEKSLLFFMNYDKILKKICFEHNFIRSFLIVSNLSAGIFSFYYILRLIWRCS